ncbi:hypothetical protein Golomagni_07318 [Golovinomyces magnicellulatus]|nr:hypothetical protein Golomagni_07318 [Golovinomyces magnicellulatus]
MRMQLQELGHTWKNKVATTKYEFPDQYKLFSSLRIMSDATRWKSTVYVGGLAPQVTMSHVTDAFIPFGEIVEVKLPKPDSQNSGESHKGFAYVEYEDAGDAKEAIDNMDQAEFFGRTIRVSQAKAPKSAKEGLGSKTAVWEQVSISNKETKAITIANTPAKEGWLADNNGEEAMDEAMQDGASGIDPMQGLEGLDVAGPKQQ